MFGVSKATTYNPQINYQGKLTNNSDAAVADGVYNMQFQLCADDGCSSVLWTETRTSTNQVQVTNGLFSVLLGSVANLDSVNFNQDLYLEMQVSDNSTTTMETLLPRKKLGTVPSAFEAGKLGGLASSSYAKLATNETITATWTFSNILSITANSASPALNILQSGAGTGISVGNGTATTTIYGSATSTFPYGATFATTGGNVGIGTTTPSAKLGVLATTEQLRLNYDASNYSSFTVGSNGALTLAPSNTGTTTKFQITDAGTTSANSEILNFRTGYNANGAQKAITWRDSSNITGQIDTRYNGTTVDMVFGSLYNAGYNSTARLTIKGDGKIGIGTITPKSTLQLDGASAAYGLVFDIAGGSIMGHNIYNSSGWKRLAADYVSLVNYRDSNGDISFYQAATGDADSAITFTAPTLYMVNSTRNVGIGTTGPGKALEINSATGADLRLTYNDSDGSAANYTDFSVGSDGALTITPANSVATTFANGSSLKLTGGNSSGEGNIQLGAAASNSYDTNMVYLSGSDMTGGYMFGATPTFSNANGPYFGGRGNTYSATVNQRGNLFFAAGSPSSPASTEGVIRFITGSGETLRMIISNAGNVGIGTGTAVPSEKLDFATTGLTDTSSVRFGINNGPSGTGTGTAFGGGLIWKTGYGNGYTKKSAGILQTAEGDYFRSGLAFFTNGVSDQTTDWSERMRINMNGKVGIGTSTPASQLQVLSTTEQLRLNYDSANYSSFTVSSGGLLGIVPSGGKVGIGTTTPTARLQLYTDAAYETIFQVSNSSTANILLVKSDGKVLINTSSYMGATAYKLIIDSGSDTGYGIGVRGVINATSLITGSSTLDIAETYPINSNCYANGSCPNAGDLVCSDSSLNSGVKKCSNLYDNTVIGIVSTDPGLLLGGGDFGNLEDNAGVRKVALAGRVPTKVSTVNGAIVVGDKLTSSDVPGVAMKATAEGPTVGIAMESYSGASVGSITVFVNIGWNNTIYRALSVNDTDHVLKIGDDQNLISLKVTGDTSLNKVTTHDIIPETDSIYDLGTSSYRWKNVWSQNLNVVSTTFVGSILVNTTTNVTGYKMVIDAGGASGAGLGVNGYIKATSFITGTTTLDLAETYPVDPSCAENNSCPVAGDVVCTKNSSSTGVYFVEKCSELSSDKSIGVISTAPGMILGGSGLNSDDSDATFSRLVALAGRVPVNVVITSGTINVGDGITASNVAGFATKAKEPGRVIGFALTSLSSNGDTVTTGTVEIFVNPHWSIGDLTEEDIPETLVTSTTSTSTPTVLDKFSITVKYALSKLGMIIKDGFLQVKEFFAEKIHTNELCIGNTCVTEAQLQDLLQKNQVVAPAVGSTDGGNIVSGDVVVGSTEPIVDTGAPTSTEPVTVITTETPPVESIPTTPPAETPPTETVPPATEIITTP
ncbi:MAG: hypothetical protein WCT11_03100 [Candidatus Magasanikbacteria bacterium]